MLLSASSATPPAHPNVRRFNPWRHGQAVANLLEEAFADELALLGDTTANAYYLGMLRNFGPWQAAVFRNAIGFVWEEDQRVFAHASAQRNPSRSDTWVLGNIATVESARGHGIGTLLARSAIEAALRQPACRHVALQVLEGNFGAARMYRNLGFKVIGASVRYRRKPTWEMDPLPSHTPVRTSRFAERAHVAECLAHSHPEALRMAEAFDEAPYQIGLGWWIWNALNGDREKWFISNKGALRTRANLNNEDHALEVLLKPNASPDEARALVLRGLEHLDRYVARPITVTTSCDNATIDAAFRECGFHPLATYLHMLHSRE